ncbi:hypothetical protein AMR42_06850 [Limnothrix sp. PR1529]|uniref:hypothetical protein n=1 Tax=Limnothrix sp. PR1529 TaxID=1704291 RepID=UPI00081D8954|nr:hypothetical protein [Limnothrix sp. PR1529]OCQ90770.1 hypothetical protein BCR12_03470 [Limnothrix sp. P13C2]PIB14284.1 hypothetical protein AMR42_06850 [Limnothrix sp. PR1529]
MKKPSSPVPRQRRIRPLLRKVPELWRRFRKSSWDDRLAALALIAVWVGLLIGYFFWRGPATFEAALTVRQLSFTYAGEVDRPILQDLKKLTELDFIGQTAAPVELVGRFSSPDPALNQQLQGRDRLVLTFAQADSRLRAEVSATKDAASELTLLEVNLPPQSRVDRLAYFPKSRRISVCLRTADSPPDHCVATPEQQTQLKSLGKAQVQWGDRPLTLTLTQVAIAGLPASFNDGSDRTITYQPESNETQINLASPTRLSIGVPDLKQVLDPETGDSPPWVAQELTVADLKLNRLLVTGRPNEELELSSLLGGKVRLDDNTLEFQREQFLVLADHSPGFQRLRSLSIDPKNPIGWSLLASGESTEISAGLSPRFPVQSIKSPTFLATWLNSEGFAAVLGFLSAFTTIFIPRLFPEK